MADLDSLSDAELRKKLAEHNISAAITGTTRKIYIKKLKQLMGQADLNDTAPNRSSGKFSSGESSEDELKKPATRSKKNTPSKVVSPTVKTTRRRSPGRASGNYNGETHTFSGDEQVDNAQDTRSIDTSYENRSSNKISSRRSLHPDSDLSIGRSNSQLPSYENGFNSANLEGTRSSLSSSASRLSRGLDGSIIFPSASLSEGRFKSRFLNNDNASSLTAKPLGDSNFISELKSRYGANKSASSTFSSRFGNDVKESDDEDHIANTVTQPTNARPRYYKWTAAESPWWKNSSVVSMSLVAFLGVFFLMIFLIYLGAARKDASISSPDTNFPICRGNTAGSECIMHHEIQPLMETFRLIYSELHNHVVKHKCENPDKKTAVMLRQLCQYLINNGKLNVWDFDDRADNNLQVLIKANPQWGISVDNDLLDIPEPDLPIACSIKNNFYYFFGLVVKLLLGIALLWVGYKAVEWRMSKADEHKKQVFKLVEQIIAIVSAHCACAENKFMAINHVRDQLIPPQQRTNMQSVWDEAVTYLESNESRMRTEVQLVSGEEFRVWRWLGGAGGPPGGAQGAPRRKVWQGQAFETMEGSVNSLSVSPTPCLKIRHMFDPEVETGVDWMSDVRNAILEKCSSASVVHVALDRGSSEGCVYLKCTSPQEAGKAYRALHGSWFDSKLVTVKYLRVERYHERFPEAEGLTTPLHPTNNKKQSLQ
ncbi:inner nuclear membrane protein Man1 [Nilaparvata lugens]|uniref:inner nuclear membrane protein Man1 n=1 Tax=Nilaparvata lugens TaxID=108931 RepID=UPI000B9921BF|nr:inner nuclear membrane protein Man1 [Nilaparvata lugens]